MAEILRVEDLTKYFATKKGTLHAVDGVTFGLREGQTLGIVGESGCGKSVTAKTIMGLIQTPPGEIKEGSQILFEGRDILSQTPEQWQEYRGKDCAIIFQDALAALNPTMTIGNQVAEKLLIHTSMSRAEAWEEAGRLLKLVGIPNPEKRMKQYPHEFSGGMRQRVVIAIAVACNPEILICDEPTTALDVTIQAQILKLLHNLQEKYQLTIIYITHDLGVVANVADRIAVMYAGDIVEVGLCEEIFYNAKHPYSWALLSSLPQLGVKGEPLYSIKGTPPNLFNEIKGDAFAPRNPQALKIDFEIRPPYFEVSPTHRARTWLLDPRAPKVEPPALIARMFEKWKEAAPDVQ